MRRVSLDTRSCSRRCVAGGRGRRRRRSRRAGPAARSRDRRQRDAGAAADVGFDQRLDAPAAARPAVPRRRRPRRCALGDYFGTQAGRPGVRLLRVPDALHAGPERAGRARSSVLDRRPARSSTSSPSASTRARRRRWRRPRRRRTSSATARPGAEQGWHFLTGDEADDPALTDAAASATPGTRRRSSSRTPAASSWSRPTARLSRYLFGIEYPPRDLQVRAGRIVRRAGSASVVDQVLLYCYHYDPRPGRYSLVAMNAVRLGGAVTRGAAARVRGGVAPARAPRRRRALTRHMGRYSAVSGAGLAVRRARSTRSTSSSSPSRRFFTLLIVGGSWSFFARQVPPPARRRGRRAHRRLAAARAGLDGHPVVISLVMFVWGAKLFFDAAPAARRGHGDLRRRQAVDVEVPAHRRAARDQRAARPGRPADQGAR